MNTEAFRSERRTGEEIVRAVEMAVRSIVRLRIIMSEHRERLDAEAAEESPNRNIIRQLQAAIAEIKNELEDALAFLEEFDPILFQKMKDNS